MSMTFYAYRETVRGADLSDGPNSRTPTRG